MTDTEIILETESISMAPPEKPPGEPAIFPSQDVRLKQSEARSSPAFSADVLLGPRDRSLGVGIQYSEFRGNDRYRYYPSHVGREPGDPVPNFGSYGDGRPPPRDPSNSNPDNEHLLRALVNELRDSRAPRHYGEVEHHRRPKCMPDQFDGRGNWPQYLAHFENVATVNNWSPSERAQFLCVSLRGEACQTSQLLAPELRQNYRALVEALGKRFHPQHNRDLYRTQIRARVRKEKESLPHLAQSIRSMALEAYPTADNELFESLCCDHFLDSLLDEELKMHLLRTESQSLDEVLSHAIKYESHLQARKLKPNPNRRYVREIVPVDPLDNTETIPVSCNAVRPNDFSFSGFQSEMKSSIDSLQDRLIKSQESLFQNLQETLVKTLKDVTLRADERKPYVNPGNSRSEIRCYQCGELGHTRPKCPKLRNSGGSSNSNVRSNSQ